MGKRLFCLVLAGVLLGAYTAQEQQELSMGQQVYAQLERQGKILRESPAYAVLTPLGDRIAGVANKEYFTPFRFILIHDSRPNAFSVPGGNVYVTDSLFKLLENKEELAGVLCHEVSHTVHHDVFDLYAKSRRVSLWAVLGQLLLGRSGLASYAIDLLANVQVMRFSRDIEQRADTSGAYTCAQAGITPWGLVWMMKRFMATSTSNPPEFLSDHPTDSHRIADLERLFAEHPQEFGKFNSSIADATPLEHPGLRDQYAPKPAPPSPAPRPSLTPRPKATSPACPPGWKFCPPPTPRPALLRAAVAR